MGIFQAFKTSDDQLVPPWNPDPPKNELDPPKNENEAYYEKILEAIATFQSKSGADKPTKNPGIQDFEAHLKLLWGDGIDDKLIGYIKQDNQHLEVKNVLQRIAEEENKYYYKWLDPEPIKDKAGNDILYRLKKLNVLIYNRIFGTKEQLTSLQDNLICQKLAKQSDEYKFSTNFLPIAISDANFQIVDGEGEAQKITNYYGVYVHPDAKATYLDTAEETSLYRYQKNGEYETIKTWRYERIGAPKLPIDARNADDNAEYDFEKQNRYLVKLKECVNKLQRNKQATPDGSSTSVYSTSGKSSSFSNNKDGILKRVDEKVEALRKEALKKEGLEKEGLEKEADKLKSEAEGLKDTAHKIATNQACVLPSNYKCFYYGDDKSTLNSFLSSVNVGEGRGGSSGYAMRCDKANEVDYKWCITANNEEDKHLAKLLSYLMNLDQGKQELDREANIPIFDGTTGFFPSNWPHNKSASFKSQVAGMKSLIHYYKSFKKGTERRNVPRDPAPPRVAHAEVPSYPHRYDGKIDFKLDNTSYRIWKKGDQFSGVDLGKNDADRADAGSVMAGALNGFSFYSAMVQDPQLKVSNSKLPATAFAKYVVSQDVSAKRQWLLDNKDQELVTTQQEWCHLFGHGDGGSEELGNFVAGSKHCNTEQLSIETGQRRITQNDAIKDKNDKQVKLTAKITAYLVPNEGACIDTDTTISKADLKAKLFGKKPSFSEDEIIQLIDMFFQKKEEEYTLKGPDTLKKSFQSLMDLIKKEADAKRKGQLFQVRRNLESNFFLYLPIARWMRYKIYYNDGTSSKKIFDHIYDAQSQSFDYNECQILDYTLERVIYEAIGKKDEYKKEIIRRVQDLVPTEEEANLIKAVLDLIEKLSNLFKTLQIVNDRAQEVQIIGEKLKLSSPKENALVESLKKKTTELSSLQRIYIDGLALLRKKREEIDNSFSGLTEEQQSRSISKNIIDDLRRKSDSFVSSLMILIQLLEKLQDIVDKAQAMDVDLFCEQSTQNASSLESNINNTQSSDISMNKQIDLKRKRSMSEHFNEYAKSVS